MSSKLSSGSLVKSVESILPKGVNLKHVLLAVLVGLLLCMMFGQTVEGYTCTIQADTTGYVGVTGGQSDVELGTNGDNLDGLACAAGYTGDAQISCSQTSAAACISTGDNTSPCDTVGFNRAGGDDAFNENPGTSTCDAVSGEMLGTPLCRYQAAGGGTAVLSGCSADGSTLGDGTATFPSCGTQTIPGPISVGAGSVSGTYAAAAAGAPCTQYCEDNTKIGSSDLSAGDPRYGTNSGITTGSGQTLLEILPNNQGFCSPPSGAAAIEVNECYSKTTSGECKSEANNCSWKSFKDYLDENSTLPKKWYIPIMTLLGVYKPGCTNPIIFSSSIIASSRETAQLKVYTNSDKTGAEPGTQQKALTQPALDTTTPPTPEQKASWSGLKQAGDNKYYDFFYLLLGAGVEGPSSDASDDNKPKVSDVLQQSNSNRVPPEFRDLLLPYVLLAESVWDSVDPNGDVLKLNGGRVIFGYNETDGLVFRNNPLHNYSVNTSDSKFHVGLGCPGTSTISDGDVVAVRNADEISCHDDSPCDISKHTGNDEWGLLTGMRFTGPGTYCQLKSCRNDEKLTECSGNKVASDAADVVGETAKNFARQVASIF